MTVMSQPLPESEAKPTSSEPTTAAPKKRGKRRKPSARSRPRIVSDGHLLDRNEEARRRLGLEKGAMDGVPSVTARIVRGAGSVDLAIEALRGDDSEDAQSFIAKYDSISASDRTRLKLEEIFTAADLTARRFVEVVTGALMQQSGDITKMMVAVAQPEVTQATIHAATREVPVLDLEGNLLGYRPGDVKAQEIFHKATGFLPPPKGVEITYNFDQRKQTAILNGDDEEKEELPSMDEYLMQLQDVLRPAAQLPAPQATIPINAPEIEYLDAQV